MNTLKPSLVSKSLYAIFELPCASAPKQVLVQILSYEHEFDLHENQPVGETHFHVNGFAQRLALTQWQKTNRKRPAVNGRVL